MQQITLDDILATDGGEAYFLSVYPELEPCFRDNRKKIKLRDDDKTASAGVFRHSKSGIWMLNDFGGGAGNKAMTAFQLCMQVNKCESSEAFKILAKFYGFELKVENPKAAYNSRLPLTGELPKQVLNLVYKELEYAEALAIFSKNAWEVIEWQGVRAKNDTERLEFAKAIFKYYNFRVLHSYEQVNADATLVHIYTATDSFPMFAIDEIGADSIPFQKIYKPKAEKGYRFMYAGKKPENFVHGLKQHKAFVEGNIAKNAEKRISAEQHSEAAAENESKKERLPEKLKEIILVSGGSDALNVAAMGYRVIWMNSETAKLEKETFKTIYKICYSFYNLPDIDPTGREAAKKLAWEHLDLKTIWLPAELANRSDGKGGFCKDVRDYLRFYKADNFKKLVSNSLPFRFWDEMPKIDKEGNQVFRFSRPVFVYEFNNVRGYNFLQMNGFWRYPDAKMKEGYRLIKIEGNVVADVSSNEVKNFIHLFLKERQMSEDLRNVMYRTPQLGESSLSNLDEIEPDFKHYGHDFQYLFFENKTWKVTEKGIEAVKMPKIYVWEKKILKPKTQKGVIDDFTPKILAPFFEISKSDEGKWAVSFHSIECDYLKFTLQTCKIHWRNELENRMEFHELDGKAKDSYVAEYNLSLEHEELMMSMSTRENQDSYKKKYQFSLEGTLLTKAEQDEQALAFVNRVFLIGYLLHRYKDPTKPWAGFVMDYRISEEGASNGRAGKGLLALGLKMMLDNYRIDARDPRLFDNAFLFGGVDKGNELIHMEDWDEFLDFERLFNALTGSLYSNAKGLQPVNLENQDFGKFLIDTNFADRFMSGSAKGRKLWSVFADFYHEDLEFYREVRTPQTELGGRRMFNDWDMDEWNRFYNFMAQCLQFYLSLADKAIKIDPPFANIVKRNSLSIMGENFRQWADTYFDSRMNEAIERKLAYEDFVKNGNSQKITPQGFFKKLVAWADFMNYRFNPQHVQGWTKAGEGKKYGYIKRSMPVLGEQGKYSTVEFVFIETVAEQTTPGKSLDNDLPF